MTGFGTLLRKELLEAWRTRRIPVVTALFVVLGILSALTARYLPEILTAALGDQLPIPIPAPIAADSVDQLQKNLGQLGAIVAVVLAMGAMANERERGTAAFILTKPASRAAFVGAKVVALGLTLAIATAAAALVGWLSTWILFGLPSVAGWAALAVLSWLALAAWAAITFLASTVTGSAMAAAGAGVAGLLGISLLGAIPTVGRFLPSGLAAPARAIATGGTLDGGALATALGGSALLVALALGCAWLAFRRQEL